MTAAKKMLYFLHCTEALDCLRSTYPPVLEQKAGSRFIMSIGCIKGLKPRMRIRLYGIAGERGVAWLNDFSMQSWR